MKSTLKFINVKSIQKNWGVILLVAMLGLWFYWFQWRPSTIRANCSRKAAEATSNAYKGKGKSSEDISFFRDTVYESCLNNHGLR